MSGKVAGARQSFITRYLDQDGFLRLLHLMQGHVKHGACPEVTWRIWHYDLLHGAGVTRLLKLDDLGGLLRLQFGWLRSGVLRAAGGGRLAGRLGDTLGRESFVLQQALF